MLFISFEEVDNIVLHRKYTIKIQYTIKHLTFLQYFNLKILTKFEPSVKN